MYLLILFGIGPENIPPETVSATRVNPDVTAGHGIIQNVLSKNEGGTRKKIYSVSFEVSLANS